MCMIKKTVRDQVYTMAMYLKEIKEGYICQTADVQRLAGNYDKKELNEIIYTWLTNDHMPELILAENNEDSRTYIVDGLQRTTMMMHFRYANYKITKDIDDPVVQYMGKKTDDKGNELLDKRGNIEWEMKECNLIGKTYETLPEELKQTFDKFQLRVVIHEDCDMHRISKLIKRYNIHKAMSTSQQAFTYLDKFANNVRDITNGNFFIENSENYSENERINGTVERIVIESVACINHLDNWNKNTKKLTQYINENATEDEFVELENELCEISPLLKGEVSKLFNSKESFVWFTTYHRFKKLGLETERFNEFLNSFISNKLCEKRIDGQAYIDITGKKSSKDKSTVIDKLNLLEKLMLDYFCINIEETQSEEISIINFVRENVGQDIEQDDIEFYTDMLDDLTINVDNDTKLLDESNKPSLLAIVAYSCKKDIILDSWFVDYFSRTSNYILDQKKNFSKMRDDLENYIGEQNNNANVA